MISSHYLLTPRIINNKTNTEAYITSWMATVHGPLSQRKKIGKRFTYFL